MPYNFEPREVLPDTVAARYFLAPIRLGVQPVDNKAVAPHHINPFGVFRPLPVVIAGIRDVSHLSRDMHGSVDGIAGEFQLVQRILE